MERYDVGTQEWEDKIADVIEDYGNGIFRFGECILWDLLGRYCDISRNLIDEKIDYLPGGITRIEGTLRTFSGVNTGIKIEMIWEERNNSNKITTRIL